MPYDNSNSGVLFHNAKKDEPGANVNLPDYRGNAEVGGVQYNLAGWLKVSQRDGSKFLSLRFTSKDADAAKGRHPPLPANTNPAPPPTKPKPADLPF
jgi:hypothetical protein